MSCQIMENGTITRPFLMPDPDASFRVHLITSDLWEAITGERLTPAHLCQLLECSMPLSDGNASRAPLSVSSIQIIMMARDRQRSRVIQTKLAECSGAERAIIFDALYPRLDELVFDPTANFVVQKLCEVATPEQQKQLLSFFLTEPQTIVDHQSACRVLQRYIECTTPDNVDVLFNAMKGNLIELCLSPNGNHIVQRFVMALQNRVTEIVEAIKERVVQLAVDNCGCRVVQRLFDQFNIVVLQPLVDEVMKYAFELATNQYGNYVVQYILAAQNKSHVSALIKAFTGHFYDFSIHKFASNVIEKCIRGAAQEEREKIFQEIMGDESHFEYERIMGMIGDQFGNYVIQRIIEYGTQSQQTAVYEVVYENYEELYTKPYAKHVISRLQYLGFEF